MNIRTALIGHGVIGKVHASIIPKYGTLCAVCDIDEKRLGAFSDIPKYTDYIRMLDEQKPDIVHICTPHYLHADMVIEALERDINVLCEKPLCIKKEDIPRILAAEKKSKAQLGVSQQNRYNPANRYLKELAEKSNAKAASAQLYWHRGRDYYHSGEWRGKWETEGGGVLINQALHTLDILQWLVGMPKALRAVTANATLRDTIEVEDTAVVFGEGERSFVLSATVGLTFDQPVSVSLLLDKRQLTAQGKCVYEGDRVISFEERFETRGKACYGSSHEALIADFYDCVSTGRHFPIDGTEAAKVIKLILAAYESHGEAIPIE